jgi:hypothetical protein
MQDKSTRKKLIGSIKEVSGRSTLNLLPYAFSGSASTVFSL